MGFTEISPDVLLSYGQLALPLALMVGSLGVPLPGTLLLLAAGALANTGDLDPVTVAALSLFGVALGDSGSYLLGRYGGPLVLERVSRGGWTGAAWQRARASFDRWGGSTVFLTRFLFTPLALPTNLIAGSGRYSFRRFLAFDLAGEAVWVSLFGGLGYLFAGSWETLGEVADTVTWTLVAAATVAIGVYGAYLRLSERKVVETIR